MQPTLVYIFFLTTCGLAQETSFPDSVVKILLDGKKLPSAVENPAPNPEDDACGNINVHITKPKDFHRDVESIIGTCPAK